MKMGVEALPSYSYTPLDTSEPSIRLLYLHRDEQDSIIGSLENFSLDSADRPDFQTLSYVWGSKVYSQSITVNGCRFPVLSGLHPVLETICSDEDLKQDWWWIDSICINQNDEPIAQAERNTQVAMMRRIYEKAERTIGWLGSGHDDGEQAVRFLKVLAKHRKRLNSAFRRKLNGERWEEEETLGEELSDKSKWASLEKLLLRPWWTRVWTLQEYLVPRRFMFYCGNEKISRSQLKQAMNSMSQCRRIDETLMAHKAFQAPWIRRRVLYWHQAGDPIQLIRLMGYISDYKATDPRDRIYSVLGLASDRSLAEPPRYQDSVQQVYCSLVKSFVELYKSLDIICFVDRFHTTGDSNIALVLPSWVPDWRVEVQPWMVPALAAQSGAKHVGNFRPLYLVGPVGKHDVFTAGKSRSPLEYSISTDLQKLKCQGILIDLVDGIGGLQVPHYRNGNEEGETKQYHCVNPTNIHEIFNISPVIGKPADQLQLDSALASRYMDQIFRCLMFNRQERYLSYDIPAMECSYHEFKTFCLAAMTTPTDVHPFFLDWFERNRSFRIGAYSLEQLCMAAKSPDPEDTFDVDLMDITTHERGFLSRLRDTAKWMARRLMVTNECYIGTVPCRAQKGDQIWILLGCSIPLILRKWEDQEGFQVIGECYLHGYMNGEIQEDITNGTRRIERICLL